jgi:serine/threonine protein kinase
VFKAVSSRSGEVIAYKKSRVSLRVRRTTFRHEARVMARLQGHPAIPKIWGYRRVEHFEYLGLELLGKEIKAMVQPGGALKTITVARITNQMV